MQARSRYLSLIRDHIWRVVSVCVVFYGTLLTAHHIWPGLFGDVFFGAMLLVPPWIISVVVVSDPGAASWARGADGEEWTAAALRKLLPHDYHVVHDLQLGHGNVDHIVVGPAGVFVVETKWSSKPWASEGGYITIRAACRQAKGGARRVAFLLAEGGVTVSPTPLVVLWGGGTGRWSRDKAVRTVDGVTAVAGPYIEQWTRSLSGNGLAADQRAAAVGLLTAVCR